MDSNTVICMLVVGVLALGSLVTAIMAIVQGHRAWRECLDTVIEGFERSLTTLENLRAIDTGPEGMRGVVARSRPPLGPVPGSPDLITDETPSSAHMPPETFVVGYGEGPEEV